MKRKRPQHGTPRKSVGSLHDKERGSALLEVVMALAITALLAATVTQIAGFGLSTVERGERRATHAATALAERRTFQDLFASAGTDDLAFTGTAGTARWRGSLPDAEGLWKRGIWLYDARLATLRHCADFASPCAEEKPVGGPLGARFDFADAEGNWQEEWPLGPPPALIRLRWRKGNAGAVSSGEVLLAPRARAGR